MAENPSIIKPIAQMQNPDSEEGRRKMECPYCKTENRDGVRYCSNCGRLIDPVALSSGVSSNSITVASTSPRGITPGGSGGSHTLSICTTLQGGRYVIKKVLCQGWNGPAPLGTH